MTTVAQAPLVDPAPPLILLQRRALQREPRVCQSGGPGKEGLGSWTWSSCGSAA